MVYTRSKILCKISRSPIAMHGKRRYIPYMENTLKVFDVCFQFGHAILIGETLEDAVTNAYGFNCVQFVEYYEEVK
jgi:hypothetical protein